MPKLLEVIYEGGVLRPLDPLPYPEKQHLFVVVTDAPEPGATENCRELEFEWLRQNGSAHSGQWVAVQGSLLVASGANARTVLEQARRQGIQHPLVVQIPREKRLPFGGW